MKCNGFGVQNKQKQKNILFTFNKKNKIIFRRGRNKKVLQKIGKYLKFEGNCIIMEKKLLKGLKKMAGFLKRRKIEISFKRYFIDALGAMAMGLFASLLIGTIFGTIYDKTGIQFFATMKEYAVAAQGPAMAIAVASALEAPPLVLLSMCAVGYGANSLGGPLGVFCAVVIASELGKLVYKTTKIDIIVTPTVVIASGTAMTLLTGPWVAKIMTAAGNLIMTCTELQPLLMGILVSVLVGIALTLPISSAAICASLGLVGLAGGAATAGCCAQMVGFAVMSFRENGFGGLIAQGLGTSMLQMGNIMKNPRIWLPPIIVSAITGPLATCLFKMENGIAVASGMGTCGLVGPIGVLAAGHTDTFSMIGMLLICFVLPAILTPIVAYPLRAVKWIRSDDLKLDL